MKGYPSNKKQGAIQHQTLQPLGQGKYGTDSAGMKIMYRIDATSYVPEATSTTIQVDLAGHPVQEGDVILFDAGALSGIEVGVLSTETNSFILSHPMASAVTAADTFRVLRHKGLEGDSDGNLTVAQGPIQFNRDGTPVEVSEDTVTPANNLPLPVKLSSVTGDINITANDLNVQTSHSAANPDSVQVGDGAEIMLINAAGEAQVSDDTARTSLASIDGKLTEGQDVSANSIPVVISTEQEAKIDLLATEVTLAAINTKLTEGQDLSANSIPVVMSTEQEARLTAMQNSLGSIDTTLTEGQDVSANSIPVVLSTEQEAKIDLLATEVTLAAINTKLTEGQDVSANSIPVVLSSEQEAKVDLLATEVTLAAINTKLTEGQDVSANSIPVVLSSEQEAKIDSLLAESQSDIVDVISPIDISSSNIPASASLPLEIIASTSGDMTEIQTIEDVGEYIGLYTGAAASEVLACILPIAGGTVKIRIPSGTRLSIKHMKNSVISTSTFFAANLIG